MRVSLLTAPLRGQPDTRCARRGDPHRRSAVSTNARQARS